MTTDSRLLYSQLPATDRLLRDSAFQPLLDTYGHTRVVNTLRAMQEAARLAIRERQALPSWCDDWA
ncbi:L-seryl-tRNA(Sec) selenium transferase, partial [Cronobacter sakazakii]